MRFSQGNQPIEALEPDGADDSFTNRIRRRTARWRFQYLDPKLCDRLVEMISEDAIAIVKQVYILVLRSQLLQRPGRSRMRGDLAMNQTSTAMLDDHEHVQLSKRRRDGEEEVTRNDP